MAPGCAARGGVASTSCGAPQALCTRSRARPVPGVRKRRRGAVGVSCSATFAVEVAEKLTSSYVLPSLLQPGGAVFNALGALSVSSLVAGSVSVSKSLWERFGRRSVFGDEADEATQSVQLYGVDITGYAILSHPTVVRAADFAATAHAGQVRRTGEAYVAHAVETARIMAGLVPSSSSRSVAAVVAALLHDVVDDTSTTLEDVAAAFGTEVASLVDGVTRLSQLNQLLRRHRRLEMVEGAWATAAPTSDASGRSASGGLAPSDGATLRALILSMVDDPRVVLLKLADRLHNMRTLHALAPDKARAVASETLGVWCSLAARLGVWAMKAELEDLCFAVLMPAEFLRLKNTLDAIWSSREPPPVTPTSDAEALAKLLADFPPQPGDDLLTPEQRLTRALLACVLPFDLLTPRQWDARARTVPDTAGAPASAAAALEALMACQKALRDELRLSAVAPGLEVMVQGRLKSLWSTHTKMRRKDCGAAEVYDARALRVVVEDTAARDVNVETEACYSLLSAVHKLWKPVGGEYDNYIANPKRSGYQSLHTAVRAPDGAPLEVQVRTRAMHEEAEYGAAAHWLYKDSGATPPQPAAQLPALGQLGAAAPPALVAAAAAVVEPIVKALATADGGPAARAAAEFAAAATLRAGLQTPGATEGVSVAAPKPVAVPDSQPAGTPSGRRRVAVGTPLLRVAEGRLNDAVVVGAEEGATRLLVAVQFVERWGAAAGRRASAAEYDALVSLVASRGWFSPGQGDFRVCLEEYALCSDGRYHKIDAYGRKLDACVEVLDLNAGTGIQQSVTSLSDDPRAADRPGGTPTQARRQTDGPRSDEEALNDKVRLLRSLLTWEQDMYGGSNADMADPADAAAAVTSASPRPLEASEVMCIVWPQGKTLRLPVGTTAGEVAAKFVYVNSRVNVNNVLVPASTPLHDGDILIITPGDGE